MRSAFLLAAGAFAICCHTSLAQSSEKPILHFNSFIYNLEVSKNEQLAIVSRVGEVAFANSLKDLWRKANIVKDEKLGDPGVTTDNICFFNRDTAFVSGFIANDHGGYNIIYHTVNGGKTWQKINFGQDGWADDAASIDDGEAWLSIAGSGIAYTKDYGFTWTALRIPNKKERFSKIYFNTNKEGVIGSLWNVIAYTNDNCKNWTHIPTPLDQKKYNKTNKEGRPEINRIAIFHDYLLVSQENLVFYSKRDTIDWVWLPRYTDFYTDAENSALYFKTNKNGIVKADDNMKPVSTFENIVSHSAQCRNGSLFVIGHNQIVHIKPDNEVINTLMYTNRPTKKEPDNIGYTEKGEIGSIGNKIYEKAPYKDSLWNYRFALPFKVDSGSLSMIDDTTILYTRNDDSLFYYNIPAASVERRFTKTMIEEFCKSDIKKLIFSTGSRGCFHGYEDEISYINLDGKFVLDKIHSSGSTHDYQLSENKASIDGNIVEKFVREVPAVLAKSATIEELDFTESDYTTCKHDILDFKKSIESKGKTKETPFTYNENNLDFDRLISMVDSIKTIDQSHLEWALLHLGDDYWSTTTNWVKISIINKQNQEMAISNEFFKPNAFHFPWRINLSGVDSISTSMSINKFAEKVFPTFLNGPNRVEVLYALVKYLYEQAN